MLQLGQGMGGHRKGLDQLDAEGGGGKGALQGSWVCSEQGLWHRGPVWDRQSPACIPRPIEARNSPLGLCWDRRKEQREGAPLPALAPSLYSGLHRERVWGDQARSRDLALPCWSEQQICS